jgi:hypothetical protein
VEIVSEQKNESLARKADVSMGARGLALDNLDAAIRFADGLVKAGMVPKGVNHAGAVVGLIEAGKELGLAPMYALSNLTFTNGRLGIMGDAAKALIRGAGALEPGTDFEEEFSGDPFTPGWTCTVRAHRKGIAKPFESSFSIAEAIAAGLIRLHEGRVQTFKRGDGGGWGFHSAPWSNYTKRMLMYRALGFLVRDRFSDILGGAVLTEELRDYPQNATAEAEVVPPAEPDPLLTNAVRLEATEAEIVPPGDEGDRIGAATSVAPSVTIDGAAASAEPAATSVPDDEAATIRAIERLEGQIVSAESVSDLNKAWTGAASLLASLGAKERKRLEKLYAQNVSGFATAAAK